LNGKVDKIKVSVFIKITSIAGSQLAEEKGHFKQAAILSEVCDGIQLIFKQPFQSSDEF